MIVNNISQIKNKNFFAIIIGSGPAGISIALELEKKKIDSLLLEAGDIENNELSEKFLQSESIGDHDGNFVANRMRMFGGTSSIWGGNCNPMTKNDFVDWPITKKDLDKYNTRTSEILNLRKNFISENINDNLNMYNLVWSNVRFNENYFDHIKKSKYITLSLNTSFQNFNNVENKINSVTCINNQKKYDFKSDNFILACGGIENSRLLLWSKLKNNKLFNSDLPIGKYYMHHPYHKVANGLINYKKFINYYSKNNLKNGVVITCDSSIYLEANNKFVLSNQILNSGMYINFKGIDVKNNLFKQLRCVAPKFIKKLYDEINAKEVYEFSISTLQEQKPSDENRVTLSNRLDPLGIPLTKIFWKKFRSEKKSARIILEEIGKLFLDQELGRLAIEDYLYNDNMNYDVTSGNHQMGGTRIGVSKHDSVVDKNLKVHDIENLYVAGSSVFRTSGHCHPTYTVVQLSLRLAEHIISITN